ncbi:STAS domain-containing protein [Roseibium marinum]|uniref:Anti-sigma factor antagonist n=1 Tax=Roseibium marinum TaxID=281252 RepID=A0A2S3V1Q2_9HYPH|nr:STAS domain-containing protein [Roseibium marinum]POF33800.1 anti-sigma B factor antagonist/stage II sporulation protein AA (anti-sigma F factor antagonist) [Roseibium marinum]
MTADTSEITIEHRTEEGFAVVSPAGKLDTLSARTFEAYLKSLVEQKSGTLLIDMEKVDYVTSFGLRSLLIIAKLLAPSGDKLVLFQVNPSVYEVLKISGFLKILKVADTLAEAGEMAGRTG